MTDDAENVSVLSEAAENTGDPVSEETRHAQTELRRVEAFVSEVTGLASNWNGTVELHNGTVWRGAKPFQCAIFLESSRQAQDIRWRTHLHEMLHAHSAGYTRSAFETYPGWEEGVVEKLQRLLRPRMLERLGLALPPGLFDAEEAAHLFTPYLRALDSLFPLLPRTGESETEFYVALLSTPIVTRAAWTLQRGQELPPASRVTFLRAFSAANAVLREPLHP